MMSYDLDSGGTYREEPLQSKRHTPRPLIISLVITIGGSSDNNGTDGPTHLQSSCAGTTEGQGDNLTSISWRVCNEETPWHTF
jgi:hypothetical protein